MFSIEKKIHKKKKTKKIKNNKKKKQKLFVLSKPMKKGKQNKVPKSYFPI